MLQVALQGSTAAQEPYEAVAAQDSFMLTAKDWVGDPGRQLQYEFRFQQVLHLLEWGFEGCMVLLHCVPLQQMLAGPAHGHKWLPGVARACYILECRLGAAPYLLTAGAEERAGCCCEGHAAL